MHCTQVKKGEFRFDDPAWVKISEDAKDLIRKLLTVDQKQRVTIEGALAHPWMAGGCCMHPIFAYPLPLKYSFACPQSSKYGFACSMILKYPYVLMVLILLSGCYLDCQAEYQGS